MIRTTTLAIALLISTSIAAQVEFVDTQRYLDLSTFTLNEPCIESNGTQFMGQFVLEENGGSYVWKILSGKELTETRTGCTILWHTKHQLPR